MVGTANIHKITKSMKMVSAAKLRGDQQRLNAATPFGVSCELYSTAVFKYLVFLSRL